MDSSVARRGESAMLDANRFHAGLFGDLRGRIGRAVIDDDRFVIWIVEHPNRRETFAECRRRIIRRYHDTGFGSHSKMGREIVRKDSSDPIEGRLGGSITA